MCGRRRRHAAPALGHRSSSVVKQQPSGGKVRSDGNSKDFQMHFSSPDSGSHVSRVSPASKRHFTLQSMLTSFVKIELNPGSLSKLVSVFSLPTEVMKVPK